MRKVLVIEDSVYTREVIKAAIEQTQYTIVGETSLGGNGINMAVNLNPDIILLDYMLPDMLGAQVIEEIKEEELSAKIIMLSGIAEEYVINETSKLGADAYLVKKFTDHEQLRDQLVETFKKFE